MEAHRRSTAQEPGAGSLRVRSSMRKPTASRAVASFIQHCELPSSAIIDYAEQRRLAFADRCMRRRKTAASRPSMGEKRSGYTGPLRPARVQQSTWKSTTPPPCATARNLCWKRKQVELRTVGQSGSAIIFASSILEARTGGYISSIFFFLFVRWTRDR